MLIQLYARLRQWFSDEPSGDHDGLSDPIARGRITTDVQIEHVLRENGGRMRQQEIVDRVGRSDAAVSRHLTRMEEEGRVRRVRRGREKVVYSSGITPDGESSLEREPRTT